VDGLHLHVGGELAVREADAAFLVDRVEDPSD
jgi:hypothetical protein